MQTTLRAGRCYTPNLPTEGETDSEEHTGLGRGSPAVLAATPRTHTLPPDAVGTPRWPGSTV